MRHYAANPDGARWHVASAGGHSATTDELPTHLEFLLGGIGREHITIWVANHATLERLMRQHFLDEDGDPMKVSGKWCQPRMGSDGSLLSARWGGRCWLRSAELWRKPAAEERAELVVERIEALRAALDHAGVPLQGTPGSSAVEGWRMGEGSGRWTYQTWIGGDDETAQLDWMRKALYGGRCELLGGRGIYYAEGWYDEGAIGNAVQTLDPVELPADYRIWVLDLRTAYPAAMMRPMPDVWSGCRETGALDLNQHGIAEVTIRLDGAAKALPIRIRVGASGRLRTFWPSRGTFRGVWTTTHLWAATRGGGGEVLECHRLIQWPKTTTRLRPYVARLLLAAEGSEGWVKSAAKGVARALYGRFAQSRSHWELVDVSELLEANRNTHPDAEYIEVGGKQILRVAGIWGPWALCSVLEDHYPRSVNPAWATETTAICAAALARAEYLAVQSGMTPLYCDTDGLHVAGTRAQLDESGIAIGDGPGRWRLEGECTWTAYYAPRVYTTSDRSIRAAAGVPAAQRETLLREGWTDLVRVSTLREAMVSGVTPGTPSVVNYNLRR